MKNKLIYCNNWILFLGYFSAFCWLKFFGLTAKVTAQIVPDVTVNTSVTQQGNTRVISGGTRAGGNLFHSFSSFSIPTGTEAFFNNAADLQNIINRVTGKSISNIDGLIRANGTANLFLINPNGIIFGPNASLNIGGSFLASTADSAIFADGSQFSVIDAQTKPLLTVSVPLGLQMGPNPGNIVVQGSGHNLSFDPNTFAIITENRPVGLQVNVGETLALLGGNVELQGGNLTAIGGRIELGSVGSGSYVTLENTNPGWVLGYEGAQNFSDIHLTQAASVDSSGFEGSVQVRGRNLILSEVSLIFALTKDSNPGGDISIRTTESVQAIGILTDGSVASGLFGQVEPEATGAGGNITIETGRLIVRDGAQIGAATFGAGNGGSLRVNASESVEVTGTSANGPYPSVLFTNVVPGATGAGGNLTIDTGRLIVRDGAQIGAATFGPGNAGSLRVNASESVEAIGSGLFTQIAPGATGAGGNLTIDTGRLIVRDGAQINAGTFGAGNAGSLRVNASESVEAIGISADGRFPSGLFARVESEATGAGGNLTIDTGRLIVRDGATVTASSRGLGNAGAIAISANSISLDNSGTISADTTAGGGNLEVRSRSLILRRGSTITTNAYGSEIPGGNITINTGVIAALENSDISANSLESQGGTVTINARAIFGAEFRTREELERSLNTKDPILLNPAFLPSSDITATGANPSLSGTVTVNSPDINPTSGLVQLPTNPVDATTLVASTCRGGSQQSEFIVTGRGGLPPNPNEAINDEATWIDLRAKGAALVGAGLAENLSISQIASQPNPPLNLSPQIIEAQGWVINSQGKVELVARSPLATPHNPTLSQQQCSDR